MYEFTMRAADQTVAVSALHPKTQRFCREYLCDGSPDFSVVITPEDIAFERQKSDREALLEGRVEPDFSDAYLELTALQRKITEQLYEADTLLFHGSVVAVDGQAYLFTAKSGTGKSTHTSLWRQVFGDRAVMVNDDKPFLKITGDCVTACGSPWCGKHKLGTNIQVPLKAICYLERGVENTIRRVAPESLLPILLQQSVRPQDPRKMARYMDLLDKLARKTAFYRLACNMDPQAARIAYEAMSGDA